MEQLKALRQSNPEKASELAIALLQSGPLAAAHLENLIRERRMKLTVDERHHTEGYLRLWANVDKPRVYDFQPENVHEEDCVREIGFTNSLSVYCTGPVEDVISGKARAEGPAVFNCWCCGKPLFITVSGENVHIGAKYDCEPNVMNYDVTIHFPTGEVLADDWPAGFSEWMDANPHVEETGSINYQIGIKRRVDIYAKEGIAHFFVGNTCPSIILTDEGHLSIRADEEDELGMQLTNICTDLWWATMVDVKNWRKMMRHGGPDWSIEQIEQELQEARESGKVFNIKPGYWRFRVEYVDGVDFRGEHELKRRITGYYEGEV